jgi:CRISPR system Cascade subunit CasB
MPERSLSSLFRLDDESSDLLIAWWKSLGHDRGERARLRRAKNSEETAYQPSFHRLLAQLRGRGYPLDANHAEALAAVAGLAAHVRNHDGGGSFARQLATPKTPGGSARISGLRFRRLLAATDRREAQILLIRAVCLLDGSVNLVSLANAAFWWNERTKKDWAYEYYATAPSEL